MALPQLEQHGYLRSHWCFVDLVSGLAKERRGRDETQSYFLLSPTTPMQAINSLAFHDARGISLTSDTHFRLSPAFGRGAMPTKMGRASRTLYSSLGTLRFLIFRLGSLRCTIANAQLIVVRYYISSWKLKLAVRLTMIRLDRSDKAMQ